MPYQTNIWEAASKAHITLSESIYLTTCQIFVHIKILFCTDLDTLVSLCQHLVTYHDASNEEHHVVFV